MSLRVWIPDAVICGGAGISGGLAARARLGKALLGPRANSRPWKRFRDGVKIASPHLIPQSAQREKIMAHVRVAVCALDPITLAGLTNCLESQPEVTVIPRPGRDQVDVVVAGFDRLSSGAVTALRGMAGEVGKPIVLVVNEIKEVELLTAAECRVVAVLLRATATHDRLAHSVRAAAAKGGELPSNLLGQLLTHTERLHREVLEPKGLTAAGLSQREVDVLRMLADGLDTNEIAHHLRYSERTVKNIIYTMTNRLRLRNRSHAVAYALRAGII
jgi:DNA-binding NarL/FixJ family response regulator